jgi:hypothetical protein
MWGRGPALYKQNNLKKLIILPFFKKDCRVKRKSCFGVQTDSGGHGAKACC